jgi:ubiquitin-small subunit ribosomal protein S27Ae
MAAKKAAAVKKSIQKKDAYSVEGDKVVRTKPVCPKCGPGTFMAVHKDRTSCGRCGYTEFNKE